MPLFYDRRGNGGTGKGTLVNPMSVRRASTVFNKNLPVAIESNRRTVRSYDADVEPMMDPPKQLTDYREASNASGGVLMWPDDRKAIKFNNKVDKFPGSRAERKFKSAQSALGISDDEMKTMHGIKKPLDTKVFD